tara:strand:+ start:263 stop:562 length:300 start_codon:yes stop_codon:yes gene_type:complete
MTDIKINSNTYELSLEGYKKYQAAVQTLEKRKEANRKCSKKYYDKTMKLDESATLEQIQKQKNMLEKRDTYQKSYYQKNREKICERQRLYRLHKKNNTE